jgi:hypothetical protein
MQRLYAERRDAIDCVKLIQNARNRTQVFA